MPMWLTPMETIAWIVTRDGNVVAAASLENPLPAGRQVLTIRATTGEKLVTEWPHEKGVSVQWLNLLHAAVAPIAHFSMAASVKQRPSDAPTVGALNDLMAKVREGLVQTRAFRTNSPADGCVPMDAADWRGYTLGLSEPDANELHIFLAGTRYPENPRCLWATPVFARDDVLREWEPLKTNAAALPVQTRAFPTNNPEDGRVPMDAADGHGLTLGLRKPDAFALRIVFADVSQSGDIIPPWRDPLLARDDVLREWPSVHRAGASADNEPAPPKDAGESADDAPAQYVADAERARMFASNPAETGEVPTKWRAAKAVYSDAACRAWFRLRRETYPPAAPFPTGADCLEAARAYFDSVPRDPFRKIRRDIAPKDWQKPGPRGAR